VVKRDRQVLCDTLSLSQLDAGAFLMEKGDKGNLFFVVDSGELEKIEDGKVIQKYSRGDSLGE